jgi:4a-hydroxytetrahydrobiopterin dehydratase
MEPLHTKKCVPCEGNVPALNAEKISELLKEIKGWASIENTKIQKNLRFIDFKHALGFINEVGDIAEYEGHHPDIFLHNWNQVTLSLSTHAAEGLTENDFILAAKIDLILKENESYSQ